MKEKAYYENVNVKNEVKLRKLLEQLPDFCKQFFIGIEPTTSSRTRIAYAYDIGCFFDYLCDVNPICQNYTVKDIPLSLLDELTPMDIEEYLSRFIARKRLTTTTKPFDIDWIKEAVRTPKQADDIPDDAFRCIYIGATKNRPFKGLTDLIDAFILLDDPRVHLTIVGEYGENDFQLAQQSKVSAQIHFLGQRSDAISFLVTSQLFILPSHRDASPRVVREAMACSVPCIVTDIPGARDLIIDGVTGLLVPPSSPQQMAASIRSLIDNPERLEAFAKASREHIIQDFSVKAYTDGFATLFRSIKKA